MLMRSSVRRRPTEWRGKDWKGFPPLRSESLSSLSLSLYLSVSHFEFHFLSLTNAHSHFWSSKFRLTHISPSLMLTLSSHHFISLERSLSSLPIRSKRNGCVTWQVSHSMLCGKSAKWKSKVSYGRCVRACVCVRAFVCVCVCVCMCVCYCDVLYLFLYISFFSLIFSLRYSTFLSRDRCVRASSQAMAPLPPPSKRGRRLSK